MCAFLLAGTYAGVGLCVRLAGKIALPFIASTFGLLPGAHKLSCLVG